MRFDLRIGIKDVQQRLFQIISAVCVTHSLTVAALRPSCDILLQAL